MKADGINDEDCVGLLCEDVVAAVVIEGRAEVETFKHAEVPGVAERWLLVDKDVTACQAHGNGVKVVGPKEGLPCRRFGGVCGRS